MPAEPAAVGPPKHPLYALTTYELKDRRREVERAITRSALLQTRYAAAWSSGLAAGWCQTRAIAWAGQWGW
jgi:hypothetical protein